MKQFFFSFFLLIAGSVGASSDTCNYQYLNCDEGECWAPYEGIGPVSIDPCFSVDMLSRQHHRPIKHLILLKYRQENDAGNLLVGAQLRPVVLYGNTNTDGKFGYLGRFPDSSVGNDTSIANINDFTLMVTYSPLAWIHAYWEFLHADQITFSHDPRQGTNHTQKVYAVVGDLERLPVYLTIGKRDTGFGAMYTVSPFTPSVTWHYFGALGSGVSVGFSKWGLHLEASLLDGGRGIRVLDTNEKGRLDNWALNGSYAFCWEDIHLTVGGGFLYSTIYDGPFGEHGADMEIGPRNGAWNVNAELVWRAIRIFGEHCATTRAWPATGSRVKTIAAGGSYCFTSESLDWPLVFSFEYSQGLQGPPSSEFRSNRQLTAGVEARIRGNVRVAIEYVHSAGFAPLMDIASPGVSVKDARQHTVLASLLLVM